MKEWENFLAARKQFLMSIGAMRRLPPDIQAKALEEGLQANQQLDVMEYLRTVEDPAHSTEFPVSALMIDSLGRIAAFPGENAATASTFLEALVKNENLAGRILAMADRKVSQCLANPEDDEIWLYTAVMLRDIDKKRFDAFLDTCRSHSSEKIREVAAFFDE